MSSRSPSPSGSTPLFVWRNRIGYGSPSIVSVSRAPGRSAHSPLLNSVFWVKNAVRLDFTPTMISWTWGPSVMWNV